MPKETDTKKCKFYNNGYCLQTFDDGTYKSCGDMTLFDCYYKQYKEATYNIEQLQEIITEKDKRIEELEKVNKEIQNDSFWGRTCARQQQKLKQINGLADTLMNFEFDNSADECDVISKIIKLSKDGE